MAEYYSSFFHIPHSLFEKKGVFDGFIGADVKLHIDPLRLKTTTIDEFKGAYKNVFLKYFDRFVLFVDNLDSDSEDDPFFKLIVEHFQFQELPNVGLGYSEEGEAGTGISGKLAKQLAHTTIEIVRKGMKAPELFVFMHLFEKGIGADRISDMTVHILRHQILRYTARISSEMGLSVSPFIIEGQSYDVPYYNGKPLHFVPTSLLADLPVAYSREDIPIVENYNTEIKRRVCKAVNGEWKDFITGPGKKQVMKNAIMNSKEAYNAAISFYRGLFAKEYDFSTDKKGFYFTARLQERVQKTILKNGILVKMTPDEVMSATREAVMLYKDCMENHRSYKLMYYEKGKIAKSEDSAQELFFMVAEAYLKAKGFDIDISPEADTGLGKLDFKFSQGAKSRVVVETKLSTNSNLIHGYVTQLPDYLKAQDAQHGIYVVVRVDGDKKGIGLLGKLKRITNSPMANPAIDVVIVDAREKQTASKRK